MEKEVESEWIAAVDNLPKSVCSEWWQKILTKYTDNGREAHNLTYLHKKLVDLKEIRDRLSNANAFTLALFFQYFNYDPKDVDFFTKNLETFDKFASEFDFAKDNNYNLVRELLEKASISSTEENKIDGAYGEEDIHYFIDLDMVALGRVPNEYTDYTKLIASEYSFVNTTTYKNLRKRVLQSFLLIPNIFATKFFRDKYEVQARINIQNELAGLT